MVKLAAADPQGEWDEPTAPASATADAAPAAMVARVRLMMVISGLTTLIAIAAVTGVVGYRVFHAGSRSAAPGEAIVTLPKGARVVSSAVADGQIVITLDIGGSTEIRIFDARTLKETGRLRFATEP